MPPTSPRESLLARRPQFDPVRWLPEFWAVVFVPLMALVLGVAAAAASTGGKKWQFALLLGTISSLGIVGWLRVRRDFIWLGVVGLCFCVPVLIDFQVWEPPNASTAVSGFPASASLFAKDIILAMLFAWAFLSMIQRRGQVPAKLGAAAIFVGMFMASGLLFPVRSMDPWRSGIAWTEMMRHALVFVFLAKYVRGAHLLTGISYAIAAQVWIQFVIGSLQFATGGSLGLTFLGERASVMAFETPTGASARVGGLLLHPNNLSLFLTLVGPLMLALGLARGVTWRRVFFIATWVALCITLLMTLSRTAWICAAISNLAVFHLIQRRAGWPGFLSLGLPLALGALGFLTLFVGYEDFRQRLLMDDRGSTSTRWQQFRTAFNVIRHYPGAGTGIGSYILGAWELSRGSGDFQNVLYRVHNGSLLTTAELGIAGGIGYHGWLAVTVLRVRTAMRSVDPFLFAYAVGIGGGMGAWFLKSMYNIHTAMTDGSLWMFAGLAFGLAATVRDEQQSGRVA